jgi:hypothetical protein
MRRLCLVSILVTLGLMAAACQTATPTGSDEVGEAAGKIAAPPEISAIGGVSISLAGITNGVADMTCGSSYNGYRVINDREGSYTWVIQGRNFGTARPRVSVGGRLATVKSWSPTRIVVDPTTAYDAGPKQETLSVVTQTNQTATQSVNTVPAILTRIYGQCTHLVALRRKQMNLAPSPTAYGGYSRIGTTYVPRRGDQYQWAGRHTAIVTAVSNASVTRTETRWTVTIEEQNADCRNTRSSFTTPFVVTRAGAVAYPRHPQLGAATLYYR